MRKNNILPITEEERVSLRMYPQKPVAFPKYSTQKLGIGFYLFALLFAFVMFFLGSFAHEADWYFYLFIIIPLINTRNVFNLFSIVEDGVVGGSTFIPWKRIKSYEFVPITINHRYYGFSDEVNAGQELVIKGKLLSIKCLVTTDEMKEKITGIIEERTKAESDKKTKKAR